MRDIHRRKIWLVLLLLGNLGLWLTPSDIVEQIARDRQTMLGRYSRTQFSWMLGLAAFTLINVYVDWFKWGTSKQRRFQLLAVFLIGFPAVVLLDFVVRDRKRSHYIRDHAAYRHPPNTRYRLKVVDRPKAFRTYPTVRSGYPNGECILQTDNRGFRNQSDLETYDVVVLGDSFAEGSYVTDESVWARQLSKRTGLSVYNLGVSGYDPFEYVSSLERFGLDLKPRYVLCMLYEGNDFRSAKSDRKRQKPSFGKRLRKYVKQSPIVTTLDRMVTSIFAPINSDGLVRGIETLDWLPLAIPEGESEKYYTFAPKQLRDLYQDPDEFAVGGHWRNVRGHLERMHWLCEKGGIRFVLVYAPITAHVTLPVVAARVPAEKVRRFTALSYKKALPDPDVFIAKLMRNIEGRESVVRAWCDVEGVPFISLTAPLREAALSGIQVYYTYDQHWTPDGHRVVAETVARSLADSFLSDGVMTAGNGNAP